MYIVSDQCCTTVVASTSYDQTDNSHSDLATVTTLPAPVLPRLPAGVLVKWSFYGKVKARPFDCFQLLQAPDKISLQTDANAKLYLLCCSQALSTLSPSTASMETWSTICTRIGRTSTAWTQRKAKRSWISLVSTLQMRAAGGIKLF